MAVPVCIETPTEFSRYTVADGAAIPLSTMCKVADPHTASAATGEGEAFAGILWEEKTISDGITECTFAKNGVWDIQDCATGGSTGAMVVMSGANLIRDAVAADLLTGAVVGKREEDASGSEVTRIRVGRVV